MAQDSSNLIWIDMEMSGLSPEHDHILEIALVITGPHLDVIAEGPVFVLSQPETVLEGMDHWNKSTHAKSGLVEKVRASRLMEGDAETGALAFLQEHVPPGISPMCGNSICQDRRFLARFMPRLEAYFHYRNLDVSTLKELVKRWKPEILSNLTKQCKHEALADIYDSISEMKHYREHFIRS